MSEQISELKEHTESSPSDETQPRDRNTQRQVLKKQVTYSSGTDMLPIHNSKSFNRNNSLDIREESLVEQSKLLTVNPHSNSLASNHNLSYESKMLNHSILEEFTLHRTVECENLNDELDYDAPNMILVNSKSAPLKRTNELENLSEIK